MISQWGVYHTCRSFHQTNHIETGLLGQFSGSGSDLVRADMTDLCANNEWNGKCQQEDRGDDDVNGTLRPSSLQDQPAKWVTHALQTATGPSRNISGGSSILLQCQTNKPAGRSAATATSLYSALSLAWNAGSQTSWLCGQKSDGWRIWQITASEEEKTRACTVKRQRNTLKRQPAGGSASPRWLLIVPQSCH